MNKPLPHSDNSNTASADTGEALLRRYAEQSAKTDNEPEHIPGCACCLGKNR